MLPTNSTEFKARTSQNAHNFRGWVPAVSGRLSFRAFGLSNYPSKAITANVADERLRYIVCYQARNASDVVLPFKSILSPYLLKIAGDFSFLCVARTNHSTDRTQEFLDGWLFIFHEPKIWKKHALPIVKELQNKLRSFRITSVPQDLETYAQPTFDRLIEDLLILSSFNAEFSLSRTGTVSLSLSDRPTISEAAPKLPTDSRARRQTIHVLSAQLFFFLRDIGHRHQHHDQRTDTIADLYKRENADDDLIWRQNTLYSMYRKVIDFKRAPHNDTHSNALGIIAYAESFDLICKEELSEEAAAKLPKYYANQTKDSINATKSALEMEHNESVRKQESHNSLLFGTVGAVLALLALLDLAANKPQFTAPKYLLLIAQYFVEKPAQTAALVLLVFRVNRKKSSINDPNTLRTLRSLLRAFHAFSRITLITVLLLIAVLSIAAMVWIYFL